MNTLEIKEYLHKIHWTLGNSVYAANRLPIHIEAPTFLISNLDSDTQPGSHWVAIHIDNNNIGQYFDSFGRPPTGFHRTFLNRNCRLWDFNDKGIQNVWTSVCGEYCLVYLYFKIQGRSMLDFTHLFNANDTIVNDILLQNMFEKYFK